jgi:hypothetical protein
MVQNRAHIGMTLSCKVCFKTSPDFNSAPNLMIGSSTDIVYLADHLTQVLQCRAVLVIEFQLISHYPDEPFADVRHRIHRFR